MTELLKAFFAFFFRSFRKDDAPTPFNPSWADDNATYMNDEESSESGSEEWRDRIFGFDAADKRRAEFEDLDRQDREDEERERKLRRIRLSLPFRVQSVGWERSSKTHRIAWEGRDGRTFYGPPTTFSQAKRNADSLNERDSWRERGYYIRHWVEKLPKEEE